MSLQTLEPYCTASGVIDHHTSFDSCRRVKSLHRSATCPQATTTMTKKSGSKGRIGGDSASQRINASIKELGDWRGEMLARVRKIIREADPEVVEEVKWRKPSNPAGVPVWSHDGMICTGETYKDKVKLTFAQGAALADPSGLFNASLDAGTRRAIDIFEGETIDTDAFKELIRAAVDYNVER